MKGRGVWGQGKGLKGVRRLAKCLEQGPGVRAARLIDDQHRLQGRGAVANPGDLPEVLGVGDHHPWRRCRSAAIQSVGAEQD